MCPSKSSVNIYFLMLKTWLLIKIYSSSLCIKIRFLKKSNRKLIILFSFNSIKKYFKLHANVSKAFTGIPFN